MVSIAFGLAFTVAIALLGTAFGTTVFATAAGKAVSETVVSATTFDVVAVLVLEGLVLDGSSRRATFGGSIGAITRSRTGSIGFAAATTSAASRASTLRRSLRRLLVLSDKVDRSTKVLTGVDVAVRVGDEIEPAIGVTGRVTTVGRLSVFEVAEGTKRRAELVEAVSALGTGIARDTGSREIVARDDVAPGLAYCCFAEGSRIGAMFVVLFDDLA